jgi:hypothetical protein
MITQHKSLILYENLNKLNQLYTFIKQHINYLEEIFNENIKKQQQLIYKYLIKIFFDKEPIHLFQNVTNFKEISLDVKFYELLGIIINLFNNNIPDKYPRFEYEFKFSFENLKVYLEKTLSDVSELIKQLCITQVNQNETNNQKIINQCSVLLKHICDKNEYELKEDKNFFQYETNLFERKLPTENIF